MHKGTARWRSRLARLCLPALLPFVALPAAHAQPPGIASLTIDLRSGATVSVEQPSIIDRPILPGSVMKIAGIAAALESGRITDRTRIVCTKTVVVDGHQLTCTHPDLHRPLTAVDALTHSCNVYMATVASQLPRADFDRVLASLGLPPSNPSVSVTAAALGLEGNRVAPRALITAVARIAGTTSPVAWRPATRAVVVAGLRGAARDGTASALGAAGIDALAKTGTVGSAGVSQGLVVGVTPSSNPTTGFALVVSGGAGMDAAGLMASRLRPASSPTSLRIGVSQPGGVVTVREMELDAYVAGVIAGEAEAGSSPAALDALAIAVRTYALANRGRHQVDGYDLCDLTHCQVLRAAMGSTTAAARRTSGRYLADHGRPAQLFYTASCGGHTEVPSKVWRGAADPTFLPSQRDEACDAWPGWESEVTARDLLSALRSGGFVGDQIRGISVSGRTASGRVAWLRIDGVAPADVSGENLRTLVGRTLGWQHLRSTMFDVTRTGAGFHFRGRGAGHGVGLCVVGAAARARNGATADDILRAYYPGLEPRLLETATTPARTTIRLVLPQEEETRRAEVQRLADRVLEETRRTLNASAPAGLVLRFHPTVESYQRATGRAWFTAGVTRGTQVDLLPLPVLRQRGLLESTVRHELAHVLTDDVLTGAPLWKREGMAVWAERRGASSPQAVAPVPAGGDSCPADGEFERAASADALRRLYDRALACYERDRR